MSLMYRYPKIYNFIVGRIHRESLEKRYSRISSEIGSNAKVLELGCGTALLASYLQTGCSYVGWDLNKVFVKHCNQRGINVIYKNIFDIEYENSYYDVIVICDVLHHIMPDHERLVSLSKEKATKVIISEPARNHRPAKIYRSVIHLLHRLFGDYDGINNIEKHFLWDYDQEKLIKFYKSMGSQKTHHIGSDIISIIELEGIR